MSFLCTHMSFACHLYVLVCHSFVTRMYSYVSRSTRMSSVCPHMYSYVIIRMSLVCGIKPLIHGQINLIKMI